MGRRQKYGELTTVVLFGLMLLPACSSDSQPKVSICETIVSLEDCPENQAKFFMGQPLSAHLVANKPLATPTIIGKILRIVGKDTIPLGTRMITLQANQRSVVQSLPFHEFGAQAKGSFLVRFVNEQNQLIAEKAFTIE